METILQTKGLTRKIEGKIIIENISFSLQCGEILAIIGPSGAGKSSLLRLLNRLDEPSDGTVLYKNQDYKEILPQKLRRSIGMVMQQPFLFPGTVRENILFGPEQIGETLKEEEITNLLENVKLPNFAERSIDNLSGGEAQRVSIARTLANKPEVLLLDEPTSALDEKSQRSIEELLKDISRKFCQAAVLVTHDIEQAKRMANRYIQLENGNFVKSGKMEDYLHAE